MKLAAAYYRVSTEEQTFDRQIDKVQEYAHKNGLQIVASFFDKESGANPDREEFLKLQEWVSENPGGVVLAAELDRLSRGTEGWAAITSTCFKYNVQLQPLNVAVTGNAELDELMMDTLLAFAKFERRVITGRMYGGRLSKLKKGVQIVGSRVPYGYTYVPQNPEKKIVVDPEEAKVVKLIFDLYTNKYYSFYGIIRELQQQGIKTKTGRDLWAAITIKGMLKNTAYIGYLFFNKRKHRSRTQYKTIIKPKEEWIKVEVDPIIDENLFNKTQELLTRPRHQPNNLKYDYLLNRVIYCAVCGKRYNAFRAGNKYKYYRCSSRRQWGMEGKRLTCHNRVQNADRLDKFVWKEIQKLVKGADNPILKQIADLKKERRGSVKELNKETTTLQADLDGTLKQQEELRQFFEAKKVDLTNYLDLNGRLGRRIAKTQQKLDDLQKQIKELGSDELEQWYVDYYTIQGKIILKAGQKIMTNEEKQEVVNNLIEKVVILPEKEQVKVYFTLPIRPATVNLLQNVEGPWSSISQYKQVTLIKTLSLKRKSPITRVNMTSTGRTGWSYAAE